MLLRVVPEEGQDACKLSTVRGAFLAITLFPARGPQSFEPPSTWTVSPVIQRASSEARKATTPPISSGCAMRLNAWMPNTKSRPASVLRKLDMSVSTPPGAHERIDGAFGRRIRNEFTV